MSIEQLAVLSCTLWFLCSCLVWWLYVEETKRLRGLIEERDVQLAAILGAAEGWFSDHPDRLEESSPYRTLALEKTLLLREFVERTPESEAEWVEWIGRGRR